MIILQTCMLHLVCMSLTISKIIWCHHYIIHNDLSKNLPTWQWGCGLEHPITLPLFSNICTHLNLSPSSCSCSVQAVMTLKISVSSMRGRVRSEWGWKHITRQVPCAAPMLSRGCSDWSAECINDQHKNEHKVINMESTDICRPSPNKRLHADH